MARRSDPEANPQVPRRPGRARVSRRSDPEANPYVPRGEPLGTQKTRAGKGDQKKRSRGKPIGTLREGVWPKSLFLTEGKDPLKQALIGEKLII